MKIIYTNNFRTPNKNEVIIPKHAIFEKGSSINKIQNINFIN